MVDSVNARPAAAQPPAPSVQDLKPQAAKSELLPAKTVTSLKSTDDINGTKQQPKLSGQRVSNASKEINIDAETQSVILKKTDTQTGEVLEQYPAESTIGLRAYAREQLQQSQFEAEIIA